MGVSLFHGRYKAVLIEPDACLLKDCCILHARVSWSSAGGLDLIQGQ
jgi:hypothetical protein